MDKFSIVLGLATGVVTRASDLMSGLPKGPTPNKYKPHVGKKQIAKALKAKGTGHGQDS